MKKEKGTAISKKKLVREIQPENNRWHYLLLIVLVLIAFGGALNPHCN